MRLAHSSLHAYRLAYERPVRWSDIVEDAAQFLLLKITSDSGHSGVAEMTLKSTWTGCSLRSLAAAIEDVFIPMLQKLDLSDVAAVRASLDGIPENHAAKTLIDNAIWDLNSAANGVPLWQAWSGRERVPLSWTVTRQAPGAMAAEAALMVERHGFSALKIKGGQSIDVDVAAMRELRAALGDGIRMYVDANGAYAPSDALRYVQAMADAGAEVVEDPCPLVPDLAFRQLQQATPTPVLVDFGCLSRRDAELFIAAGARALSLKPGRFGLSDTRRMGALAHAAGCKTVVGMFGESALGTLAALQLAATLPSGSLPAEVTWFLAMTDQIVAQPVEISGGMIQLPSVAGSAALIDWDRLARLAL
jgi:L-alanine-DL-glutamate epimerase-like enolase superfamily enzyme